MITSPSPTVETIGIGSVLGGRYRLDTLIGSGGMGQVYRAEHIGIGRMVAIKILHTELGADREATQRFQREALASGRLDHPNIVAVSDFGMLDDGTCYLVMAALDGASLGARLERTGAMPWLEAVEIMRGVLLGLAHAHRRGVVHRDIKPDNIFLAFTDGVQVVKLLDFGIAKLIAGDVNDPATTRAGLTMGTPAYLSPEQAVGSTITAASDLYSASVVLFEMLAGKGPFDGPDPLAIMMGHVSRPPPTIHELAPDVELPPGLEPVLRRGLEKVRAERIASADEYVTALEDIVGASGNHSRLHDRRDSQPIVFAFIPTSAAPVTSTHVPSMIEVVAHVAHEHGNQASIEKGRRAPGKWVMLCGIGAPILVALGFSLCGHERPPAREPAAETLRAAPPTEVPSSAALPGASQTVAPVIETDAELDRAIRELKNGRTCEVRRAAIPKLVELGDARAITTLEAARYRMYGGLLGMGEKNANYCLIRDAEAAIKKLGAAR